MKQSHTIFGFLISILILRTFGQTLEAQNNPLTDRADKPNIVFILADDLGYSDVNCFNGLGAADYYETPHIDLLATQGMKFSAAYTNGPNCAPTRAALMSGQYYPRQPVYTVATGARGREEDRKLIPLENGNGIPASNYKSTGIITKNGSLETKDEG